MTKAFSNQLSVVSTEKQKTAACYSLLTLLANYWSWTPDHFLAMLATGS